VHVTFAAGSRWDLAEYVTSIPAGSAVVSDVGASIVIAGAALASP
jgi:hypothetical protein